MNDNLISAVGHVSFIVKDLKTALAFYVDLLDMKVLQRPDMSFEGAWLEITPDIQLHLLKLPNPDELSIRPEHGGRDHHVAFYVSDLTLLKQRLSDAGIVFTLSKSGRQALFCRDPDNNALEFIA